MAIDTQIFSCHVEHSCKNRELDFQVMVKYAYIFYLMSCFGRPYITMDCDTSSGR